MNKNWKILKISHNFEAQFLKIFINKMGVNLVSPETRDTAGYFGILDKKLGPLEGPFLYQWDFGKV